MVTRRDLLDRFRKEGRIVIVGASLAGVTAAETMRKEGYHGQITIIGDEPSEPYDRPPLSKQVLMGMASAMKTTIPRIPQVEDVQWRLGKAATRLDPDNRQVLLADGQKVDFDRLLIATGVRARLWPNEQESTLKGVYVLRTNEDAQKLQQHLNTAPEHVLIIGAGFTGSEIASVCRSKGLKVTVTERSASPLMSALGGEIGSIARQLQSEHGVDLRCNTTVTALEGDDQHRLRRAHLSDGSILDVEIAIVALGSIRNTEWLRGSNLAAGQLGITCDAGCRAFDINGIVTDDIFVAGDVARFPHPLYDYQLIVLEHWGNAMTQAETAAFNMVNLPTQRRPHLAIPSFWSVQFEINIKSVGLPPFADEVAIVQGSVERREFIAAYGHKGRIVAAVSFNQGKWLPYYERLIAQAAAFPPVAPAYDTTTPLQIKPAQFPATPIPSATPSIALTGYAPGELRAKYLENMPAAPKVAVSHP
ncbi:NAD(P)/FAD-dependent oxidoreductase [Tengunoibacter tsumagoiensis]|uniref:Pyridine nucleotide-disulfide oxidoreductase n=1 Tax=Tengunoibacter tsumagoiensis TaxID=2014871 RepID=A0A402AA04_9CHLR|nr:FAD/NAD(P)-binding oxidoreductase [Tengunoibacter tsumagoiensis]GCE15959.1 pyridine nucleotide-disulfide oxidoreductase [Tengunoibacter tsumagoiensis]